MHRLKGFFFYAYSVLLGVGAALVGFVIGLLVKNTSKTIATILLLIGLLCITVTILLARRPRKPPVERIGRKLP